MTCTRWFLIVCSVLVSNYVPSFSVTAKEVTRARKIVQAPTMPLLSESTGVDAERTQIPRTPDRSPILRSFNPRLKPIDPYAIPMTINRRSALKW